MKLSVSSRTKVIIIVIGLCSVAILAALAFLLNRPLPQINTADTGKSKTVRDTEPASPGETTGDSTQPNNPQKTEAACIGDGINNAKFVLTSPAYVYLTALDAKNKTNPDMTYPAGEYSVFKCHDGIANVTRSEGVPGGWIDPENPYAESVIPEAIPAPSTPPALDVMTLDNTLVNWSHEYPTAFVREYNGWWSVAPGKLYLTFDCGYDYNNLAASIMDTLRAKGIKAVFFVTGDFMNDRPDLIKRMVAEGHAVGNHSYAHLNQPQNLGASIDTVVADIRAWEAKYRSITGANPSTLYFRPPGGAISRRSLALMNQLGYKTTMWGVAYKDWDTSAQPSQEVAMTLLRKYSTSGDIVLLHGVSQTSTDVLGQYIDEYRGKGFEFMLP